MAKSNQEFTQMYVPEFKLTQVADINLEKLTTLTGSTTGVQVLSQFIAQKGLTEQINVNEFVFIVYLNKRNKVIAITNLAIGGIDMTVMDVRLVFGLGLKCGASAMIVAHNHPTGNLQPSEADRQIARRIKEVGVLLQINALDFLIITSNNGYYSFADNSEYAQGGMMAKGGITEHGLRVGDTIVSEIDKNTIVVDNAVSGQRTINISTGNAMAKGGRMGFKALSEKVAKHYAGKSVPAKYQPEYGKFYDGDEAKTVGNKVAAKVYRLQQGK